jgi:hypothetical protein
VEMDALLDRKRGLLQKIAGLKFSPA